MNTSAQTSLAHKDRDKYSGSEISDPFDVKPLKSYLKFRNKHFPDQITNMAALERIRKIKNWN